MTGDWSLLAPVRPRRRQSRTAPLFSGSSAHSSDSTGIEGGRNDYERKTWQTKRLLRVKFRHRFASGDRLDLADKNLTTVILRGKLGGTRYGIEAATYCGVQSH